ncbi:MAG: glycine cleavage system protein GcvH [Clostridia bacterium]|nr:glycine cleavage system protein GcvH [Clostridia bacterium]
MTVLYAKSHEWIKKNDDGTALIGISDFAQHALGSLVFVNLPEVDDEIVAGEPFADVESVKAVSDVYSPVSGVVLEVNEELLDAPEKINDDALGAWFIKVGELADEVELFDEAAYAAICAEEE